MAKKALNSILVILFLLSFVDMSAAKSSVKKAVNTRDTWKIEKHVVAVLEAGPIPSEISTAPGIDFNTYVATGEIAGTIVGTTSDARATC